MHLYTCFELDSIKHSDSPSSPTDDGFHGDYSDYWICLTLPWQTAIKLDLKICLADIAMCSLFLITSLVELR